MATTIGRVEFNVGADGRVLEPELRRVGRTAGKAGGEEAGESFNSSFGQRLREKFPRLNAFANQIGTRIGTSIGNGFGKGIAPVERFAESLDKAQDKFDRFNRTADTPHIFSNLSNLLEKGAGSLTKFGDGGDRARLSLRNLGDESDRSNRRMRSHLARTIAAWTGLVLAIGQGTAALGSGVGSALTALISSLSIGLASAGGIAGAAVAGFGVQVALAVAALQKMKDTVPGVQGAVDNLGAAWGRAGEQVASVWGPSVIRFLDTITGMLSNSALLDAMGQSLASITDAFTAVLNGPGFQQLMGALTTIIPGALTNLGSGFASVFGGLASMFAAAAPSLATFAQMFNDFFGAWAQRLAEATADGSLQEFFNKALDSLVAFLDLAGSLGNALGTLFAAGAETGNSMLNTLTRLVDQWDAWMNSVEGQQALQSWFENGERIFNALLVLAGQLGKMFADLVTPESIDRLVNFIEGLGDFLPIAGQILEFFGRLDILNILVAALNTIGSLLTPLMPTLLEFAETIGGILVEGVEKLGPSFERVGVALLPLVEIIAELIVSILPPLIDIIVSLVDYLALFVTALMGASDGSDDFKAAVQIMGDVVGGIFTVLATVIGTTLQTVGNIMISIGKFTRGDFTGAFEFMRRAVDAVFVAFGGSVGSGKSAMDGLYNGVRQVLEGIGGFFTNFGNTVANVFQGIIGWISSAVGWFNSLFSAAGKATGAASNARASGGGLTPRMAAGGILNGPRRILAGEAGSEAIVPLNRALSQVNPSVRWLSAMAQGKTPSMASGGVVGGRGLTVEAGGITVVDRSGDSVRTANETVVRMFERVAG